MWTRFRVKSSSVTQKEENPQSSPPPPLHPCLCLFSDFMLHVCSSWILPMARALHMSWTISDLKSFCSVCFVSVAVHSALPCTLTFAGTAIFGAVLWPVSGKPSCFFFALMDGVWAEEGDGAGENTKLHLAATAVSPWVGPEAFPLNANSEPVQLS